ASVTWIAGVVSFGAAAAFGGWRTVAVAMSVSFAESAERSGDLEAALGHEIERHLHRRITLPGASIRELEDTPGVAVLRHRTVHLGDRLGDGRPGMLDAEEVVGLELRDVVIHRTVLAVEHEAAGPTVPEDERRRAAVDQLHLEVGGV